VRHDPILKFYTIDPVTQEYIIDIGLNEYHEIFNSIDSAVHVIRDLNGDLKSFVELCSYDIDLGYKIVLRIHVKAQAKDEDLEKVITESIRNYFSYTIHVINKTLRARMQRSALYVLVSTTFLVLAVVLSSRVGTNILRGVILQGLTVGGWIFLWEAFLFFFMQSMEHRKKRKIYRRLLETPVIFVTEI
jgi:hypothetical protein